MVEFSEDEIRRIQSTQQASRDIKIISAADIVPKSARFLWLPYLPLGQVVIVAGAPGHGKSQLAALMAGLATRGALPGDINEPSRALMMCAEDDLASTVVPRLMAVNADLYKVDFINVVTEHPSGLTSTGMIRLPGDVDPVHRWARDHADARLVVMDPVASFFDRSHSTISNQDVRDTFEPIVAIAQTYAVTVVIIMHLNKNESRDFASRIAESHGFQALARSVMALGPDPDDPEGARGATKVLAVTKANLVKPGMYGMRCEVRSVLLPTSPPIETSELVLLGKCEISADDLLMPSTERSERIEASVWLDEFLGERWVKVNDVKKAAMSDGWAWRMIRRVRENGDYRKAKEQGQEHGPWWMASRRCKEPYPGSSPLGPLGLLDSEISPQGDQGGQEGSKPGGAPSGPLGLNGHQDEFRRFEQRKLGEREDEE